MSIIAITTFVVPEDGAERVKQALRDHADIIRKYRYNAQFHSAEQHRGFAVSVDGAKLIAVSVWPSQEAFEGFLAKESPKLQAMLDAAGLQEVQSETEFFETIKST